jgi:hypothetical protein
MRTETVGGAAPLILEGVMFHEGFPGYPVVVLNQTEVRALKRAAGILGDLREAVDPGNLLDQGRRDEAVELIALAGALVHDVAGGGGWRVLE